MPISNFVQTGVYAAIVFAVASVATAGLPPLPPPGEGVDAARLLQAAGASGCVCEEERVELERYRELVAAARTLEEAQERAARPSRLARKALALARWLVPERSTLEATRARLEAYEAAVARTHTPAQAAGEFDGLVRVAGNVNASAGGCHYDGTEIIAIILGFLFFIIPGIILLIVFC